MPCCMFISVEVRYVFFQWTSYLLTAFLDWRRPPHPVHTADYATYVQILTWFLDTPSPEAPFSVHRMALAGKELGTDVGQWFGPSVAAGAIRFVRCPLFTLSRFLNFVSGRRTESSSASFLNVGLLSRSLLIAHFINPKFSPLLMVIQIIGLQGDIIQGLGETGLFFCSSELG